MRPQGRAPTEEVSMGLWRALLLSSRSASCPCALRRLAARASPNPSQSRSACKASLSERWQPDVTAARRDVQATYLTPEGRRRNFASQAAVVEAPPEVKETASASTPNFAALPTSADSDELLRIRHSCSHIMAMSVQRLFPGTQVTVGPWIEHGFFYDFDTPRPLVKEDLKAIQKDMKKLIRANLPFEREEVTKEEAKRRIEDIGETYKLEILDGIVQRHPDAKITLYHLRGAEDGDMKPWWDLCAGPHVERTGNINPDAIALESVAGAYWRGSEANAMLQRIYGTAWRTKEELSAYNDFKTEAARRDHRKLGQELGLFSISETAGPGLVFWHPKGAMIRHLIEGFWKETHLAAGYQLVNSPHVAKTDLWRTSGHYDFYKENMFDQMEVEGDSYQLKPMNCPFHIEIYKAGFYSYRDFPLRWAELGTVYRYERSGTLQGLFRVRGFTQDDAHIFCLPSQLTAEIKGTLDLVQRTMAAFGFTQLEVLLSTRPDKSVGTDANWELAENALQEALQEKGWDFKVNEADGAFYGPKIDINIRDAIGRRWQCSTIQLDFNLPERFQMEYADTDQQKRQPIMLHRAIFGSIERFFGILLENYAGAFPLWLAPIQVRLLCVTDAFEQFAQETADSMRAAGLRVEVMTGARISKHIRTAEKAKTPVMCVIGQKEADSGELSVRTYHGGDQGSLPIQELINGQASRQAQSVRLLLRKRQ